MKRIFITKSNTILSHLQMKNLHDFSIKSIDGSTIDFSTFAGKKVLIVNVASECGFTPQYQQLQELYENAQSELVIIGVPCNDFGGQEPGSADDIQQFCAVNYGVKFPMAQKISILQQPHPLYKWLTNQSQNGVSDVEVRWNFHKFLIGEDGQWLGSFSSSVSPFDDAIISHLKVI